MNSLPRVFVPIVNASIGRRRVFADRSGAHVWPRFRAFSQSKLHQQQNGIAVRALNYIRKSHPSAITAIELNGTLVDVLTGGGTKSNLQIVSQHRALTGRGTATSAPPY